MSTKAKDPRIDPYIGAVLESPGEAAKCFTGVVLVDYDGNIQTVWSIDNMKTWKTGATYNIHAWRAKFRNHKVVE